MELKLFTDLIDALGKVAGGLKAIVNLPKPERETIRRTLDETYRLIDTTLNMVIIRLGDIQLHMPNDYFLREVDDKESALAPLQAKDAINAFQWCKALLNVESPQSLAVVQRFEVDSKFFRCFTAVLLILRAA